MHQESSNTVISMTITMSRRVRTCILMYGIGRMNVRNHKDGRYGRSMSFLIARSWISLVLKLFAFILCITTLIVAISVVQNLNYSKMKITGPSVSYGKRHIRLAAHSGTEPVTAHVLPTELKPNSNCNQSRRTDIKSSRSTVPCTTALSLGCVTNDPFSDSTVHVNTSPLQFTNTQPVSCPDRLCFNFALADKKHNTCWNAGKKSIPSLEYKHFHCRFINGSGRPPVGLISFPGSGNTWVRGLLEQVTGVCTGSVYCDMGLLEKGFAGESIRNGAVLVVKSHSVLPLKENETVGVNSRHVHFGGIIFIVRNVFDALEAEMNRQVYNRHHMTSQSWKSHVFTAGKLRFGNNKVWTKFVHSKAPQWSAMIKNWIAPNRGHPVLVIRYEDMKLSPAKEVKKMLRFLNVEYNDTVVEERLKQDFTIYHRQKRQSRDVFSKELQGFVNSVLSDAEKYVRDNDLQDIVQIGDYHR